jgi:hypothetical protein
MRRVLLSLGKQSNVDEDDDAIFLGLNLTGNSGGGERRSLSFKAASTFECPADVASTVVTLRVCLTTSMESVLGGGTGGTLPVNADFLLG